MTDLSKVRCIAFDLFGTLLDMSAVPRDEINAYVEHVRRNDFSPYEFPVSWEQLKFFDDVKQGLQSLIEDYQIAIMSNCDSNLTVRLLRRQMFGLVNSIVDLEHCRVYKPHQAAYHCLCAWVHRPPEEILMVTANPTFGDIEGAAAIGMPSQVIRHGFPNTVVELAEMLRRLAG